MSFSMENELAISEVLSGMVITIDGPAGSGKSTTASMLAARLGLRYLDTGAMYRGVTYALQREGLDPESEESAALIAAGISMLPEEPYEAAKIDGASWWQILRSITIPLLRPILVLIVVLRILDLLKIFAPIYIISGGGPGISSEILFIYAYKQAFLYNNMGPASAASVLIFVVGLSMTMILFRVRGGK